MPSCDQLKTLVLNILRLDAKEKRLFEILWDYKVPPLRQLLSEDVLLSVGLSPIDLKGESWGFIFFSLDHFYFLLLTKCYFVAYMRPKELVELKKTLPQKREAWATTTSLKRVKFLEPSSREVPVKQVPSTMVDIALATSLHHPFQP